MIPTHSLTKQFMLLLPNGVLGGLAFLESQGTPMHVPSAPDLNLLVGGGKSRAHTQLMLQMAVGAASAHLRSVRPSCPGLQLPICLHISFEKCS